MTNTGRETGRLLDTVRRALAELEDSIANRERVRWERAENDWGVEHYDAQVGVARNELIATVATLVRQLQSLQRKNESFVAP